MHYVIALFDSETGDELGRVTVDANFTEGSPTETNLLTSDTAHGKAYQYFARHFPEMEGTEVRRVSLTDTRGPEDQFIENESGRGVKL